VADERHDINFKTLQSIGVCERIHAFDHGDILEQPTGECSKADGIFEHLSGKIWPPLARSAPDGQERPGAQ
jgi:hypothetical protein